MAIKFDVKKIKRVDITDVRPNTWNPKDKKTPEYEIVKKGIKEKGLRLPIVVREVEDGYEIIDGEQRWTACGELGYEEVLIYNEGDMSDKEAREMTIWYEQKVPFNEVKLAELVTDMKLEFPDLTLPFSSDEMEEMANLVSFDWDEFQPKEEKETKEKNEEYRVEVTAEQLEVIREAVQASKDKNKFTSEAQALTRIAKEYLGDSQ